MLYMVMLSVANLTTLALAEKKCQGHFFFTFLNILFACVTFSRIQESTQSFLGLGLMRNILECSLVPNVTAALYSMH